MSQSEKKKTKPNNVGPPTFGQGWGGNECSQQKGFHGERPGGRKAWTIRGNSRLVIFSGMWLTVVS